MNVINQAKLMTDKYPESLDCHKNNHFCIAKADTGASNHYWRKSDKHILKNIKNKTGPSVQLPNSEIIDSTAAGQLSLSPELSSNAQETMVLPKLTSSNLISLGQLCDDNCNIILNKKEMCAIKNNKIILKGYRNLKDGLWDIPIKKSTITTQCCESPPMHPSLYPKRHPNKNTTKTGQKYPEVSNS